MIRFAFHFQNYITFSFVAQENTFFSTWIVSEWKLSEIINHSLPSCPTPLTERDRWLGKCKKTTKFNMFDHHHNVHYYMFVLKYQNYHHLFEEPHLDNALVSSSHHVLTISRNKHALQVKRQLIFFWIIKFIIYSNWVFVFSAF